MCENGGREHNRTMRSRTFPPQAYFAGSAVFHYLGPAFAVLLFARVAPAGVAWLRIVSAAIVFAAWRRPWRALRAADRVYVLTRIQLRGVALGFGLAFANAACFALYIVLAHRISRAATKAPPSGAADHSHLRGIDGLGAAMLIAAVAITPLGGPVVAPHLLDPVAVAAGIGVGISSSVIPYVCDQLAMARLRRETYSLMVSLLPATATVVGLLVLGQVPTARELAGVCLVVAAVAVHNEVATADAAPRPRPGDEAGRAGLRIPGTRPSR